LGAFKVGARTVLLLGWKETGDRVCLIYKVVGEDIYFYSDHGLDIFFIGLWYKNPYYLRIKPALFKSLLLREIILLVFLRGKKNKLQEGEIE
jgi:hypothetical protein